MSLHAPLDFGLFAKPEPSEAEKADEALDRIAEAAADWLTRMRAALLELFRHRAETWGAVEGPAFVTSDDSDVLERRRPELRLPAGVNPNVRGALFRAKGWRLIGRTRSSKSGSHGNLIGQWAWED